MCQRVVTQANAFVSDLDNLALHLDQHIILKLTGFRYIQMANLVVLRNCVYMKKLTNKLSDLKAIM